MNKKLYKFVHSLKSAMWFGVLLFILNGQIKVLASRDAVAGAEPVESEMSKLSEARSKLEHEKVALQKGVVGYKRVRVGRRRYEDIPVIGLLGREVALALLDREGKFHIVRGVKRDNHGFETLTPGYTLTL